MAQRKFPTWATGSALLSNGDPDKADPGTVKQDIGWVIEKPLVQYMNWIMNLVGKWLKSNNEVKVVADTYEAEAGETVLLNNSAGVVGGFLPALPIDRQRVTFGSTNLYSVFAVTISGNGNDIMEVGTTALILDADSRLYEFVWDNSSSLWEVSIGNIRGKV